MSFVPREAVEQAVKEALEISPKRNFKQSVDLIVVLRDIDLRSPQGRIREVVILPHPPKKHVRICVAADGDMAVKAKEVADRVLTREELQGLVGNRKAAKKIAEFCDWVIVKADLMPLVGRTLAPALGPRGKVPIPVPPNANIAEIVKTYRSAVMLRAKDQPQVMCRVGTEDMPVNEIVDNIFKVLSTLEGKLPNARHNIAKVIVKLTMGPPVEVKLR
ncbi:50S ribosomal protein L1 [Hyperthermus butylicus]|uniref:Large ribosomal subunit protein uL1 n=1 Tax=Hyperthermus butylicus (strain DSM 5456 / JCM 9403 / PLM1-5) TaxID=415426 RepID=RL1_HYPBU|nr:50S ribosomal protein L1 [Hyperthermus butylicus]A2BN64.1 RecName: Full=Large ribosomal subunit protein uL1; AltName: Full=50S ribosomal protein L1 [Hyperthermus butylicus DSM 5456]ABM81425.1 50S ribosomal protein L1P [Hyperthermus butylicus DSM 5456]